MSCVNRNEVFINKNKTYGRRKVGEPQTVKGGNGKSFNSVKIIRSEQMRSIQFRVIYKTLYRRVKNTFRKKEVR